MQNYNLIQAFRNWEEGTSFKKFDSGIWQIENEDGVQEIVSNDVMETLLDMGYLEDVTPEVEEVVETPVTNVVNTFNVGETFFYISGAGDVKSKSWTDSIWCRNCANFLGAYRTQAEAEDRANVYGRLIRTFNSMN